MKKLLAALCVIFIAASCAIAYMGDGFGDHKAKKDINVNAHDLKNVNDGDYTGDQVIRTTDTSHNSPPMIFEADNAGAKVRSRIYTAYGADPYLVFGIDDDSASPAMIDTMFLKDKILGFVYDGVLAIGGVSDNRPSDVNAKYGMKSATSTADSYDSGYGPTEVYPCDHTDITNLTVSTNATAIEVQDIKESTGVHKIIAGTNITLDPVGGQGDVTINATGGGSTSIEVQAGSFRTAPYGDRAYVGDISYELTFHSVLSSMTETFLVLPDGAEPNFGFAQRVIPYGTTDGNLTAVIVWTTTGTVDVGDAGAEAFQVSITTNNFTNWHTVEDATISYPAVAWEDATASVTLTQDSGGGVLRWQAGQMVYVMVSRTDGTNRMDVCVRGVYLYK